MADRTTTIRVKGDTEDAERKLRGFGQRLEAFRDRLMTGFGIDWAGRVMNLFDRLPLALESAYRHAVRIGVAYNSALENTKVALGGILYSIAPDAFGSLEAAGDTAKELLKRLREEARQTTATFDGLTESMQGLIAAALGGGIPLEKIPATVSMISRAVGGMMPGAPSGQIMQEGRALLTGDIDQSSFIAKALKITPEHVRLAREQGRLYEFLESKLAGLNGASKELMRTLTGLVSNLKDALQNQLGEGFQAATERIKLLVGGLQNLVDSPAFLRLSKMAGDTTATAAGFGKMAAEKVGSSSPDIDYGLSAAGLTLTTPLAGAFGALEGGKFGMSTAMIVNVLRVAQGYLNRTTTQVVGGVLDTLAPWHGPIGSEPKPLPKVEMKPDGTKSDSDEAVAAKFLDRALGGLDRMRVPQSEHGLYFTTGGSQAARDVQNTQRLMMLDIRRIREKLDRADLDINHLKL